MNNYERLRNSLTSLDGLLYTKTSKEIVRCLLEIHNRVAEDPNYYNANPYRHEVGMNGKGITSNYTHFFRGVAHKLFVLADTQSDKCVEILSLLPPTLSNEISKQYQAYEADVSKYMDKTSGLRKYQSAGKWGYKDKSRRVVIAPIFDEAFDYCENTARVIKKNLVAVIDVQGNYILNFKYQWLSKFREGFAIVKHNDRFGYINDKYKEVVKPKYEWASDFYEGMAIVKLNGKYGYINAQGNEFIKPKYDKASIFNNGNATVMENSYAYRIDKSGMRIL